MSLLVESSHSRADSHTGSETLEATNYDKLTIVKSGLPSKARSHINNGDRFYFSGRHMWETTYMDSYFRRHEPRSGGGGPPTEPLVPKDPATVRHRYAVLQAVVGRRRLDALEALLREKLTRLLKSGETLSSAFKVFDRDRTGRVNLTDFSSIARLLGMYMTETEAQALFGRFAPPSFPFSPFPSTSDRPVFCIEHIL